MEASENLWIAVTVALAAGVVIGIVLTQVARRVSGSHSSGTRAQLESLQLRFEEYQQEVSSHFKTTASLVAQLNRSHQEIQMTRERLLAALEEPPVSRTRPNGEPLFDSLEPPRDYAPKGEDSPGTLSEDYGFERRP